MGIGRGNGNVQRRFPQTPNTVSINPERLEPFGGKLGGMQQPMMTIDNNPNVMSGIGAGVLLNQLDYPSANINNGGSNAIVGPFIQSPATTGGAMSNTGQILAASPNAVPQQQVAMSNVLNTQQEQLAQNGIIGPVQATNVMNVPQQQFGATLTTNVGPSVEFAQQVPNVAMLQATNGMLPQQQLGATMIANEQLPNVAMGQAQTPQAINAMAPQQQLGAMVTTNVGQFPNVGMGQAQTLRATNIMAQQQQLGANAGPSVIEGAQQIPNVAFRQTQPLGATNIMTPQQQLGTTVTNVGPSVVDIAQQVPKVAMGQTQTLRAINAMVPQQQLGAMVTTNFGPSAVEIGQRLSSAAMGQANTLRATNIMAQQQQLIANAAPPVIEVAQQLPNIAMGPAQTLQAINIMTPQKQLGATITTNAGPSVVEIGQQLPNAITDQAQTLQAINVMTPQQQLGATITANTGSPVIEVTQQQLNVAADPLQTLQGSNTIATTNAVGDQMQQQTMLNQFGPAPQITVSDPRLLNLDNAIASTQQQLTAIQNGIAEAKLQEQIIEANNKAAQQAQAQLRIGELGSIAINPTQQQLINAGNTIDVQQQTMGSAEQLQQQQFLEMNNAIQNQAANAVSPFPQQQQQQQPNLAERFVQQPQNLNNAGLGSAEQLQQQQFLEMNNAIQNQAANAVSPFPQQQQQPNLAERFVQQLQNLNIAGLQQQVMSNTAPMQQDISNLVGQQTQNLDMNNMVQNPVPEIITQPLQQQIVDVNNAVGQQGQFRSSEIGPNMVLDPSQQMAADIAMQQQLGSNIVNDPVSVNLDQPQGLNVMPEAVQQPQTMAGASNMLMAEQFGQMTQPQTLVDMTNTLNPEQQMGSAITGSNIVIDPSQQQPIDLNIAAEAQPQTIGSVTDPSQQAAGEMANAAGSTEQLMGTSPGQQTSFGPNPMTFQQQMINPNAPFDHLWQFGSMQGGMPYIDPLQELALVRDPYAQEIVYSNQAMPPTFVNGVPLPNGQPLVEQRQVQTGQSEIPASSQQSASAQGGFTAQQQTLNPQEQQTGVVGGQLGPWNQIQSQQTPWLSNLQPDPNQPYMINDPSLSGVQQVLQQNSQPSNAAVSNLQQTGAIVANTMQQYQPPQTVQIVDTVQQPQVAGTQITSPAQSQNTASGNANIASSSQLPVASLGTPAASASSPGSSGTIQQNAQLSDQSLQYRQAILDSILSSLQPQVVYNPLSGLDVPVDSSASTTATQTNQATLTAAAGGASQVVQKESALPPAMSAPLQAEIGKQPTSPQPTFTVSDVIKSLATGGQVSNLPDQQTILADKKTSNARANQQILISNQFDMTALTTPSPLPVATFSPAQDAGQLVYGTQPRGSIIQPVYTPSAFVPRNDFWSEMALASAIFNHPKQPLTPKQDQQKVQKGKQQEKQFNSLLQSLMLASLLPENNAVKQAPSGFKTLPVVTRGDLSDSKTLPIVTRGDLSDSKTLPIVTRGDLSGSKTLPVVTPGDLDQVLSASNKLNSSKPITTFSKTATLNSLLGMTPSTQQNSGTFTTKIASLSQQTTSLGITLAPVTLPSPSLQNQRTTISQSVVRRNQPETSFTPQSPRMDFSTGRKRSTQVMAM
ncbi:hypothetical protein LOTGIDRAFT_233870 [Lottia gigantea]|uniref:Uncharacterized protein n=1 Tax=Lottia gigantea TaxID=225164 RepID=V3ZGQ8_LOTGI|nr:hypothetical protein LOTGIDRAFT_233870 [Lottia gigantea]ESO90398.1 hypothetical protein LOTGIDRAFT_233870 [Lottia gigantea]